MDERPEPPPKKASETLTLGPGAGAPPPGPGSGPPSPGSGPPSPDIAVQVCRGVGYAHGRGMSEGAAIKLTVTQGPHRGRVFDFDSHDMFIFGRAPDCHCPDTR